MEVDLGAMFGGPNHLFSLCLSFTNWVPFQVRIGLGLGSECGLGFGFGWQPAFKKNVSE